MKKKLKEPKPISHDKNGRGIYPEETVNKYISGLHQLIPDGDLIRELDDLFKKFYVDKVCGDLATRIVVGLAEYKSKLKGVGPSRQFHFEHNSFANPRNPFWIRLSIDVDVYKGKK